MEGVPAYNASMGSYGYVYIPQRCEPGTGAGVLCRLHMFFHGCTMQVLQYIEGHSHPVYGSALERSMREIMAPVLNSPIF